MKRLSSDKLLKIECVSGGECGEKCILWVVSGLVWFFNRNEVEGSTFGMKVFGSPSVLKSGDG